MKINNISEQEQEKTFYEYLAIYMLSLFVNPKYFFLHKKESPDLQSNFIRCGIEVRRAIDKDEGLKNRFLVDNFGKRKSLSQMQNYVRRKHVNYEIHEVNGVFVAMTLEALLIYIS